ncbi:MAG: hypothetical protein IJK17_06450 [Lachnospiraceae bacterium]|nr:hypothetical protein [Lachnospiraceae bacterium]
MSYLRIKQHRINRLDLPKGFKAESLEIGVPVRGDEASKVGLEKEGDWVLPSSEFGLHSRRNAYGYSYANKKAKKERCYVSTNWIHPFGNRNASQVAVDIYRRCYPRIFVSPCEIELGLVIVDGGKRYVVARLTEDIRREHLKEAVNLLLEIYGECYLFNGTPYVIDEKKHQRCNWEILPPGILPSRKSAGTVNKRKEYSEYDIHRQEVIESYDYEFSVEGLNGFKGYYAYVFKEYCVLEATRYGNATYILPRENWEKYSQMTKGELVNGSFLIERIEHKESWEKRARRFFREKGIPYCSKR